jgi:hypothetical protein
MSKRLYLLDFDRTLFDNHRFFEDFKSALNRTHKLDLGEFTRTWEAYYEPEAGGYNPHRHHQDLLGLTPDELDEVITSELGHTNYLFPDARQWLSRHMPNPDEDLIVVTMGHPRYQKLKFSHTPDIKPLRKVVVRTNKGAIIRRHLNEGAGEYGLDFLDQHYESISLIDDSADTFTALGQTDRISGIRIARPGEKYSDIPTPPYVRHITSFGDLS